MQASLQGLDALLWTKRKSFMIQLGADTSVFVKAWSENDKCSRGDQGRDYLKEVLELYKTRSGHAWRLLRQGVPVDATGAINAHLALVFVYPA
eukprot:383412-Amphidinium_carterae.1